jgi:predicted metal-dependent phosphoesterase TrpH
VPRTRKQAAAHRHPRLYQRKERHWMAKTKTARGPVPGSGYQSDLEYKKADLHLHSHFSYDVLNLPELSPRALYDKAVERGMGFFTLTDHETLKGCDALRRELETHYGDHPPIPLIYGIEIKVKDPAVGHTVHINVLGLDWKQMGQLARRRRSIDAFLEYCRQENLYHAYNHPFWFERGERGHLARITGLIQRFPVVELNAGRIPQLNGRTLELARRFGKEVVATSDSHTGQVGKGYTMAPGDSPQEFLENILKGRALAVPHHVSLRDFMREIRETMDLVFVRQSAFRPKRTFLQQTPTARRIARVALGSDFLMRPRPLKIGLKAALEVIAVAPAYAFILQQRKMHWQLGEMAV